MEHPAPWWYRWAAALFPERCREIPEAVNPDRIVLRQVAIWYRHIYLQQFASSEDPAYMHSHQWHRTIAIGLWGSYSESRIAGPFITRRAPYIYTMDASVVHHVLFPSRGHTSIFIGLWRDDNLKFYYGTPRTAGKLGYSFPLAGPYTRRMTWSDHIQRFVKRI